MVLGIVIILAVVLIGYAIYERNEEYNQPEGNGQPTAQQGGNPAPQASSTGANGVGTGTKKLSYGDAINTYKNRFQFSQCHGNPGIISIKKGQPVMLDNRDKVAHTIKANGQTIRVAAYDYALLYPANVTVGNVSADASNVTCDGGGAATLNVEK